MKEPKNSCFGGRIWGYMGGYVQGLQWGKYDIYHVDLRVIWPVFGPLFLGDIGDLHDVGAENKAGLSPYFRPYGVMSVRMPLYPVPCYVGT